MIHTYSLGQQLNPFFCLIQSMCDKADWCDDNLRYFNDICKGEIEAGNMPDGQFRRYGCKNLTTKYKEKTSFKQTKKQLKNKLDNVK
jgi:hypothetical protein